MPNDSSGSPRELGSVARKFEAGLGIFGVVLTFSLLVSFLLLLIFVLVAGSANLIFANSTFAFDSGFTKFIEVIVWPFVAMTALVCFALSHNSRGVLFHLLGKITNVKLGGYEVSFSESVAQKIKRDVEKTLHDFAVQGRVSYDRASRTYNVRAHLESAVKVFGSTSKNLQIPTADGVDLKNIRATVHIRDVVFEESLYQLEDYYPKGGGRGRRFSVRYGAIGLAWRRGKSQHWNTKNPRQKIDDLIQSWGMTEAEAMHSQKYEVAICVVLYDQQKQKTGVLYLDAESVLSVTNKCEPKEQDEQIRKLISEFERDGSLTNLAESIGKVSRDVARAGTFIEIYS